MPDRLDSGPLAPTVSRSGRVAEWICQAILDGTFTPGEALVERDIAAQLGVSKTPVREALRALLASGLVTDNAYRGISVRTVDAQTVRDLYESRMLMEPEALHLACLVGPSRTHGAARAALNDAAAAMEARDVAGAGLANRRFHRALYADCGNAMLLHFLDQMQDLTAFVATAGWRRRATWGVEAQEHERTLDAFEIGAADGARDLMRNHICSARDTILGTLTPTEAAGDVPEQAAQDSA